MTVNKFRIGRLVGMTVFPLGLTALSIVITVMSLGAPVQAQSPSPTPLELLIRTRTPIPELIDTSTPTRTPTPERITIRAEARESANIRAAPSLDSEVYAKVVPGQFFPVTGRYGKWLQIRYERAPTGLAWVYEDVIALSGGDPALIPEIDPNALPTANVSTAAAQQTAEFLTSTPGAPETATVAQASATGVFTRAAAGQPTFSGPLPTFTYPPLVAEATLPTRTATGSRGNLPAIVPILGLGIVGIAGILISALRRGR